MKRRAMALLCAVLLVFHLAVSPARAAEAVYFAAINDNLLPLSDSNMPFWSNGYLYVDSSIFTMAANTPGKALGIYRSLITAKQLLVMSSDKDVLKLLFFDLAAGTVQDNQGISYYPSAIQRNGVVYVPLSMIAYYFDLTFNRIRVPHGYLVRIKNERAALSDEAFADAATYLMEPQYEQYIRDKQPAQEGPATEPTTPDTPGEEPAEGKTLYLCLEASDGAAVEALLDELDRAGAKAAFYCTETFLRDQGDLLRRMAATGHAIGLVADSGAADRTLLEQLESGNSYLYAATCGKTRLVYLKKASDQERQQVREAGYRCLEADMDRSSYQLKSASNANLLLKRASERRDDVSIWLADTADAVGLRAFLTAAKRAEDRCLAMTETA